MPTRAEREAAYALVDNPAVGHERVLADHARRTRARRTRARCAELAAAGAECLLAEDTTSLDYTAHPATAGLGWT